MKNISLQNFEFLHFHVYENEFFVFMHKSKALNAYENDAVTEKKAEQQQFENKA